MPTPDLLPLFAVSEFTHWHQTFEQDVVLYRQLGVEAMELCGRKLSVDPVRARDQLAFLKETGLRVTSIQPRVHALFPDFMCPELADPLERMAQYRETIDLMAEFFPDAPLVTITGKAPGGNYRLAQETARRLYPALADYAADQGLRLMLEPLHPILMNTDTFICSLDGALRLIKEVERKNFGLLVDVWHVWHDPFLTGKLLQAGERIFGVHLSDWPELGPRCAADRLLPGEGCINLPSLLAAIEQAGYRGAYCLEIFSSDTLPDSLWREDAARVIERGRAGFFGAWEKRLASPNKVWSTHTN